MSDCDTQIFTIPDPLTISALGPLIEEIKEKLSDPRAVVINLGAVHTCDTAGIQMLLAITKQLQGQGRSLDLKDITPEVASAAQRIGYLLSTTGV